jgi:elongation factor 2
MSKSPNKHNRLYVTACPLADGIPELIEKGDMGPKDDPKIRAKRLIDEFEWEKEET